MFIFNNWDKVVPFYLMSYRATPKTTTGFSPYYLLHGREMPLPNSDNLKAKLKKKRKFGSGLPTREIQV